MIIFGTRSTHIASEQTEVRCNHCQSEHSVWVYIYQKYVHVFWVPFFPFGKTVVSECGHCKQVLRQREFGAELQLTAQNLLRSAKTPWWTYFILFLVLGFILLSTVIGIATVL